MTKKKDKRARKERSRVSLRTPETGSTGGERRKAGKGIGKNQLTNLLLELFHRKQNEILPLKFIFDELQLKTHPGKALCRDILEELEDLGYIIQTEKYRYKLNVPSVEMTGVFRRRSSHEAVFIGDEGGEVIPIADRHTAGAVDGDQVRVAISAKRGGAEPTAEVIAIVKRTKSRFVGTLEVNRKYAFLCVESKHLDADIYIPQENLNGGRNGDKAVVEVVEWPARSGQNPLGKVVEVLGKSGNNDTEMHAILAEYGLPYSYPADVEREAYALHDPFGDKQTDEDRAEIERREDFRRVTTFTIDPDDAKDFDDALSIRAAGEGLWEVGVHIADVTYYVREGSLIDKEAVRRATSVYLVDRTIPMLPERLCNFICSLRPHEEKMTYSAVFVLDGEANVRSSRIVHTTICSDRRFTYDEAQHSIEHPDGDYHTELAILNRLAQTLRERRLKSGAIDFDRVEVKFRLDDHGRPLSVYFKEPMEANQLIEEFMLLANRTVAERGPLRSEQGTMNGEQRTAGKAKPKRTFVYRIHDLPDPEKLSHLAATTSHWGYKLQTTGSHTDVSRSINGLLSGVRGKPEQQLIETLSLRAMQKARYSVHNIGHYGLAFDHYTHFTSPIRRYPDLMIHRLLTRYAEPGARSVTTQKTEELCEHCSAMEQLAASAERASEKYMQAEFMKDKVGQVYDGVISSVAEWGFYVELNENKCEGLVPVRDLEDDYYVLDERNLCLRGRRHNRTYKLGDQVSVQVARVDMERRQLDFSLV